MKRILGETTDRNLTTAQRLAAATVAAGLAITLAGCSKSAPKAVAEGQVPTIAQSCSHITTAMGRSATVNALPSAERRMVLLTDSKVQQDICTQALTLMGGLKDELTGKSGNSTPIVQRSGDAAAITLTQDGITSAVVRLGISDGKPDLNDLRSIDVSHAKDPGDPTEQVTAATLSQDAQGNWSGVLSVVNGPAAVLGYSSTMIVGFDAFEREATQFQRAINEV